MAMGAGRRWWNMLGQVRRARGGALSRSNIVGVCRHHIYYAKGREHIMAEAVEAAKAAAKPDAGDVGARGRTRYKPQLAC